MTTYISGPMTGLPDHNYPAFFAAARMLQAAGYDVINPAEINSGVKSDWSGYMRRAITGLMGCDSIYMLPGWRQSRGALLEHDPAIALGMSVLEEETCLL